MKGTKHERWLTKSSYDDTTFNGLWLQINSGCYYGLHPMLRLQHPWKHIAFTGVCLSGLVRTLKGWGQNLKLCRAVYTREVQRTGWNGHSWAHVRSLSNNLYIGGQNVTDVNGSRREHITSLIYGAFKIDSVVCQGHREREKKPAPLRNFKSAELRILVFAATLSAKAAY